MIRLGLFNRGVVVEAQVLADLGVFFLDAAGATPTCSSTHAC
jgi:hypothetical protein